MTSNDLRWPLIIPNDLQLRVIFFFGKNSVLNFHGLDPLHIKLLISQLMVKLQPTISVNTGIQLMKFKLFISVNSAGLLMVIMKERSLKVIFTGSVIRTAGPVRVQTDGPAVHGPVWILLKCTIIVLSKSVNKLKVTPVPSISWIQLVSFLISFMTSFWRNTWRDTYVIFKIRKLHVTLKNILLHPGNDDHWLSHNKQVFQLVFKSNQSALPIAPVSVLTIPSVTATDFFIF